MNLVLEQCYGQPHISHWVSYIRDLVLEAANVVVVRSIYGKVHVI